VIVEDGAFSYHWALKGSYKKLYLSSIIVYKVKLSRYTPWRRLGERRYSSYSLLSSALDGGEWSA
jgi:hypothetical protein